MIHGQQGERYYRFNLIDLFADQQLKETNSFTFLTENTLIGKVFCINKNDEKEDIYPADLVYWVINGTAKLKIGKTVISLDKGSIAFVPRNMPHSFYDITVSLQIFALISLENKSKQDTLSMSFTMEQIEKERIKDQNVWNPFLKRPSMTFGLYMLPKSVNGDSLLIHRWDEVNLITNGNGKFQVNDQIMDVKPGDIIYVQKGNGHFFHSIQQDLDILIFFEKRSVQEQ